MIRRLLTLAVLAAAPLPALAGDVILAAMDVSFPKAFVCGETKTVAAGRYGVEVVYEPTPSPHSVLKVTKSDKALCTVTGSGTNLNEKMATTKVRLFTRVDNDRKAIEVVVITPTDMRGKVRNQVFYIPLAAGN